MLDAELDTLDGLLKATQHVTHGLMVNYNQQQRADHDDWYVALRAYEFGESSPESGAAKRIVDRAIVSLTALLQRRPYAHRRNPRATGTGVIMSDPATMTAGQINKELDKLDARASALTDQMIEAGRGRERYSDIRLQTDPLSLESTRVQDRRQLLHLEIEMRYGPRAPNRLPSRGFPPRTRTNPRDFGGPPGAKGYVVTYSTITPGEGDDWAHAGDYDEERGWVIGGSEYEGELDEASAHVAPTWWDPEFDDAGPVEWMASMLRGAGVEANTTRFSAGPAPDFHPHVWYTGQPNQDFRTGAETTYSYHLLGFTENEQRAIFDAVTRRRNPATQRLESGYAFQSSSRHPREPETVVVDDDEGGAQFVGYAMIDGSRCAAFKVPNVKRYYFQVAR